MKRLQIMLSLLMAVLLVSCGGEPPKENTTTTDTATATSSEPVKPVFSPFKVIYIQHRVKNFGKWEQGYLANDSMRNAYGLTQLMLGRDLKDSNLIYITNKMEDMAKAKDFSTSPGLKNAMKKAGVSGPPQFSYAEVIRSDDSPVESTDRLGVAHHVKDFAAWVKVFDAEGPATRASYGIVDRMLARSLVDSNMVYITFAVTDMAKARARASSPELKKLMTDAGVDSPPTMRWYRIVR